VTRSKTQKELLRFLGLVTGSVRDLAPIVIVVAFFQLVVLQQPIPNLAGILLGLVFVLIGLTLFIQGLELALFPIGEAMADALAHKGSLFWLLAFAFALGFGTTAAEPALIAVVAEAAKVAAAAGVVEASPAAPGQLCVLFAGHRGLFRRRGAGAGGLSNPQGLADPIFDHWRLSGGRRTNLFRAGEYRRHRL
jgi:Putative PTS system mannose-specific, factor IIC